MVEFAPKSLIKCIVLVYSSHFTRYFILWYEYCKSKRSWLLPKFSKWMLPFYSGHDWGKNPKQTRKTA